MNRRGFLLAASGLLVPQEPLVKRAWWFLGGGAAPEAVTLCNSDDVMSYLKEVYSTDRIERLVWGNWILQPGFWGESLVDKVKAIQAREPN